MKGGYSNLSDEKEIFVDVVNMTELFGREILAGSIILGMCFQACFQFKSKKNDFFRLLQDFVARVEKQQDPSNSRC